MSINLHLALVKVSKIETSGHASLWELVVTYTLRLDSRQGKNPLGNFTRIPDFRLKWSTQG